MTVRYRRRQPIVSEFCSRSYTERVIEDMKQCRKCKQTKEHSEFPPRKVSKDGFHSYCRSCMRAMMKANYQSNPEAHRIRNKLQREKIYEIVNEIKAKSGCKFCPEREVACLDFHHPDPLTKENDVATFVVAKNLVAALAEIQKCIIVCSNCHRKIHAGIIVD